MKKIFISITIMFLLAGCFPVAKLQYAFGNYPSNSFITLVSQPNIHYEKGGEGLASQISSYYPAAKEIIAKSHGSEYCAEPNIYICVTNECYQKFAFVPLTSGETSPISDSVILNGRRLVDDNITKAIFTHELSHAYWFSRGIRCEPRWWEEGMAVYSSGGGGAEKVSVKEAILSIQKGIVFKPSSESSCTILFFGGNSAQKYHMSWPMYYRQVGMFVEYLNKNNPKAFGETLANLRSKQDLQTAFKSSYGLSVDELWRQWVESISKIGS